MNNTEDNNRKKIIELFAKNIAGKKYIKSTTDHCGSEGHWLEEKMGIKHNSSNAPDILNYEMKSKTSKKTTFGKSKLDIY